MRSKTLLAGVAATGLLITGCGSQSDMIGAVTYPQCIYAASHAMSVEMIAVLAPNQNNPAILTQQQGITNGLNKNALALALQVTDKDPNTKLDDNLLLIAQELCDRARVRVVRN